MGLGAGNTLVVIGEHDFFVVDSYQVSSAARATLSVLPESLLRRLYMLVKVVTEAELVLRYT